MAYTPDLPAAARRHLQAADVLDREGSRRDVAGYLYGLAAECACKAMMQEAGMQSRNSDNRREDPFYAHFPELRTMLRDGWLGRRGSPLLHYVDDDNFMSQWNTQMRYCRGSEIKAQWIEKWREQAHLVVDLIGT